MTTSAPPRSQADIVVVLRAAGCVFAEEEAALLVSESSSTAVLDEWVRRRVTGEPLEVIMGWAEFSGLRIAIDPGVFVPRRRTEYLVRRALRRATPGSTVIDLCCGSGALGAALASAIGDLRLYAADIEPAAIACARRNLAGIGEVFEGDLFEALPGELRGHVDLLLVNAPYVPTGEIAAMPAEARDYEPRVTLDGGFDGLDVHRRVAAGAADWLTPGGALLIEISRRQAPTAATMFESAGLTASIKYSRKLDSTVLLGLRP